MSALTRSTRTISQLAIANVVVATAVFVVLVVSPAPVHFPSTHREAVLLAIGALVILVSSGVAAAIGAASMTRGGHGAASESPVLEAMRAYEAFLVISDEGVVGVLDEVIGTREGELAGFIVADGWLGRRRWFVPAAAIRGALEDAREILIEEPRPLAQPHDG